MTLTTIKTMDDYNSFDFEVGQRFTAGALIFDVINIDGELSVKNNNNHVSTIKIEGMHDPFIWAIECGYELTQVK